MGFVLYLFVPPSYGFCVEVEFRAVEFLIDFFIKVYFAISARFVVERDGGNAEDGCVGAGTEGFDVDHKVGVGIWGAESHISVPYSGWWLWLDIFWAYDLFGVKWHILCPVGWLAHDVVEVL